MTILPLAEADIPAVAALHRSTMTYSLNSRLGGKHLEYVYAEMGKDPQSLVAVARVDDRLAGAVSATIDPELFKKQLFRQQSISQWLRLGFQMVRQPGLVRDAAAASRSDSPLLYKGIPVRAYLASIFVAPGMRRLGVGKALVQAVEGFFRDRGVFIYRLDTRVNNVSALAFYRRLGFLEAGSRGRDMVFLRDLSREGT